MKRVQLLTRTDEATVRDRERLVKEYGVRSIIDLRTKYAVDITLETRRLTHAEPNTLNKRRNETQRSKRQRQFRNPMTMLLAP